MPKISAPAVSGGSALRIGTRGSTLALAQARAVARELAVPSELVTITTAGDLDRARGDKTRWVTALETALVEGDIDLAVHSAKDVAAELAPGTAIVATPRRADPMEMVFDIERRIVDPNGMAEIEGHADQPPPERRHEMDPVLQHLTNARE